MASLRCFSCGRQWLSDEDPGRCPEIVGPDRERCGSLQYFPVEPAPRDPFCTCAHPLVTDSFGTCWWCGRLPQRAIADEPEPTPLHPPIAQPRTILPARALAERLRQELPKLGTAESLWPEKAEDRLAHGVTILADRTGVSRKQIRRLVDGYPNVSDDTADRLTLELGIPLGEVLPDEEAA